MKTLMTTLLVSAAVVLAFPAVAAGPASAPRPFQQEMTKEQHLKFAEEHFNAMDANKDGKITAEERAAKRPGRGAGPGAAMPAEVTKAQAMKLAEERFNTLDTNKDGKITQEERRAQFAGKAGMHRGGHMGSGPDGRRMGRGPQASVPASK